MVAVKLVRNSILVTRIYPIVHNTTNLILGRVELATIYSVRFRSNHANISNIQHLVVHAHYLK